MLSNLGYALQRQGRYDEAIQACQEALSIAQGDAEPLLSLANIYLELGEHPDDVIQITETAIQKKRADWLFRMIDGHVWGDIYGSRAWAYALLGDRPTAEVALRIGFQMTSKWFMPGLAGFYYRAGRARQTLNDSAAARDYWSQAQAIDPQGGYGNLAAQMLQDIGTQKEKRSTQDAAHLRSIEGGNRIL